VAESIVVEEVVMSSIDNLIVSADMAGMALLACIVCTLSTGPGVLALGSDVIMVVAVLLDGDSPLVCALNSSQEGLVK